MTTISRTTPRREGAGMRDDADMSRPPKNHPGRPDEGDGRPGREDYRSWTSVICRDCCDFTSQMRILICTALTRTRMGTDSGSMFLTLCLDKCPASQLARNLLSLEYLPRPRPFSTPF